VVGILSQVVVLAVGVLVALAAGYFRGRVDGVLMQMVDVMLAIPDLLFVIVSTLVAGCNGLRLDFGRAPLRVRTRGKPRARDVARAHVALPGRHERQDLRGHRCGQ
jgi:ABC-type dipeptide/oligopeptide/nickel transport system permease subunit